MAKKPGPSKGSKSPQPAKRATEGPRPGPGKKGPSRKKRTEPPSERRQETTQPPSGDGEQPAPAASPVEVDGDESEIPGPEAPVVGIVASAGGLEAFTALASQLPADPGFAVVIVQHLSPGFESSLPELLAAQVRLPVLRVTESMPVEPNRIYVAPADAQTVIDSGAFHLLPRPTDARQHCPGDVFLRSLADYAGERAIGVVLSGTASDGANGLRDIKAVGGLALAQDPQTAKFDGMPRAAVATGVVDAVLGPAELGSELVRISQHPVIRHVRPRKTGEELPVSDDDLQRIFVLLRRETGVDFTHYKQPTIRRRLQRRMVLHKIPEVDRYIRYLQGHPAEIVSLYQDVLIHVTRFFRDPESFDAMAAQVFPHLADRRDDGPIRIWVPGCSTGEEAYSVAIALTEFLGEGAAQVPLQVFATDISDGAIEVARAGVYPASIATDVSAERLQRFFSKVDSGYRIGKQIRDRCVFARQDLTRDPPFSKLDLIVCRNVLIYLGPPLQKQLISVFHYALRPSGFLVLANAETVGTQGDLFTVLDKRHRIYAWKLAPPRKDGAFPELTMPPERTEYRGLRPEMSESAILHAADQVLLTRFAPAGVVVNDDYRVVQFRGSTGKYLEPTPGEASLNLLTLARDELLYPLRTALHESRTTGETVRRDNVPIRFNSHPTQISLEVVPLAAPGPRHFLVLFEEQTDNAAPSPPTPRKQTAEKATGKQRTVSAEKYLRLQEELAASRDYLQSTIQSMESANEELQSANEEILSANEELQSTNEELDTAKEELQSTNEELNTVNEELHGRNEELSRLNSDLVNLLGSVQIAIVMVARDLRIRRFTPMAERVLNLIVGDVGRPISHIKPNIECPDLEQLITRVIETMTIEERMVRDRQGNWFSLRIRPYKNLENRIDGAVLALFDVEADRRGETGSPRPREVAEKILDGLTTAVAVVDSNLRVKKINHAFEQLLSTSETAAVGEYLYEVGGGTLNNPELRGVLNEVDALSTKHLKLSCLSPTLGELKLEIHTRPIELFGGTALILIEILNDG